MKCPVCNSKISIEDEICPNCKTNIEVYEEEKSKGKNAKYLGIFATINLIISIISSIVILCNFSIDIVTKNYNIIDYQHYVIKINWWGISGGLLVLISGLTIYFLLKTISDIYCELKK